MSSKNRNDQTPLKRTFGDSYSLEDSSSNMGEDSPILTQSLRRKKNMKENLQFAGVPSQLSSDGADIVYKSISKRHIISLSDEETTVAKPTKRRVASSSEDEFDSSSRSESSSSSESSIFDVESPSSDSEEMSVGLQKREKVSPLQIKPLARTQNVSSDKDSDDDTYWNHSLIFTRTPSKSQKLYFTPTQSNGNQISSPSSSPFPFSSSIPPVPSSKRPKRWNRQQSPSTTTSLSIASPSSSSTLSFLPSASPTKSSRQPAGLYHKRISSSVLTDIYSYIPSKRDLAMRKGDIEKFENWLLSEGEHTEKLCILTGPPGCGKVGSFKRVINVESYGV